jgi:hypothetical protein
MLQEHRYSVAPDSDTTVTPSDDEDQCRWSTFFHSSATQPLELSDRMEGEPTPDNGFTGHVVAENDVMHDEAMEDAMEEDLEGVLGAAEGGDNEDSLAKDDVDAGNATTETEKNSVLMDDASVTRE